MMFPCSVANSNDLMKTRMGEWGELLVFEICKPTKGKVGTFVKLATLFSSEFLFLSFIFICSMCVYLATKPTTPSLVLNYCVNFINNKQRYKFWLIANQ